MSQYPEHEKLHAVKEKSQAIGEFIEWLLGQKALTLAKWREDKLMPEHINIEELLAEFFKIDLGKLEQEKQAMLEELRRLNERDAETGKILEEIRDHAAFWHSDMAKRVTVEKHLAQKGMLDVEAKVNELIKSGKLILIPKPKGDYLKEMKE